MYDWNWIRAGDVAVLMKMTEEYQLELNSNEICRNCLAQNGQLKSLFRCDIIDGEIWPIPKVYQSITNISVNKCFNISYLLKDELDQKNLSI